jgi:hypothetical protein
MPTPSTSRIDRIIRELEHAHGEAQDIFNAHVDYLCAKERKASFGELKHREITGPAGSALNYTAALEIVRKKIIGDVA